MTNPPQHDEATLSRRELLRSAAVVASGVIAAPVTSLLAQATIASPTAQLPVQARPVPPDPTKVPGLPSSALGNRSPFENPALAPVGITTGATNSPLQSLRGTITPSDLHFQRHHNGIALIDPTAYRLTIHGLVDRPLVFTLDELKRFPAETRTCFIECSGNGRSAYRTPKPEMTPQDVD